MTQERKKSDIMRSKFFILFATISLCSACHRTKVATDIPPMRIEVATVRTDTVPNRKTYIGHISANYEAVVQPRVNGYLVAAMFKNGMPVRKGQLIFRLDGRQQRADMLSARASLESAKAREVEAKNNYDRAIPLAKINAISQAQLDQYTAEYAAAKANVNSARQALKNANLETEYTDIYSSIDGIIASSEAHIGDFVGPGTQFSVLTTIQNIDTVGVDIAIPMQQYLQFSGRKTLTYDNDGLLSNIKLYLADGELYPIDGQYNYTRTNVSDAMGTIVLVISFPNPDYALKAGQFARIRTDIGRGRPFALVPQQCISQTQNINSLWVIRPDSTAEYREVTLGDTFGDMWIVEKGVGDGETVALTGQLKLHNGTKVIPIKR